MILDWLNVRQARLGAVAATLALVTGCASMTRNPEADEASRTTVQVDNRGYVDMNIFALEGGAVRRRLGIASAARTTTLVIPSSLVGIGRDVQFVADPIGGTRQSVSQRIFVRPGEQVVLMITP